jgi:hypothetical protein
MVGELWIGQDLEEADVAIFKYLYRNFPGGTEENLETHQSG